MGTRNLTAVFSDGEYKVAQYGQWDGYLSGQGVTILDFMSTPEKVEQFKKNLGKVRFIDYEKDKEFIDSYNGNVSQRSNELDNRTPEQTLWYECFISRDLGGKILESIAYATDDEILLKDSIDFAGDSLFCEYAYVIDLDKNTLEVFEGFNKSELDPGERFASAKCNHEEYKPVKLMHSFPLASLPSRDEFLAILEP